MPNLRTRTKIFYLLLLIVLMTAGVLAWRERSNWREATRKWQAGPLPEAVGREELNQQRDVTTGPTAEEFEEMRVAQPTSPPPSETDAAETQPPVEPTTTSPQLPNPEPQPTDELPAALNLRVPMVYQSPFAEWTPIDEDACEEASMLMVKHYLAGRATLTRQEMKDQIDAVVAYQMDTFGFFESTTAEQNVRILKEHFGFRNVRVIPFDSAETVKRELAAGRPVILPANGKLLKNPNFRNGGPPFHMLVIKGYTATGQFITNDPGTRLGADYTYPQERLLEAAADWDGNGHAIGPKLLIVVDDLP